MQMRKVGIKKFCPKPTGSPLHKAKHIRTQSLIYSLMVKRKVASLYEEEKEEEGGKISLYDY